MTHDGWTFEILRSDLLIIGGGAAGIAAAVRARELEPELDVLVMEKAHVKRSGCLAAGINAINAYLNPGETPLTFLAYVREDAHGLVREDLVLSLAEKLNSVTDRLAAWGLPLPRDAQGNYLPRGRRSVRVDGEGIKPLMARALEASGARVLNRVNATNFFLSAGRVRGAFGFSMREKKFYLVQAFATVCATGGAAGIYKPNNPGAASHKMWYCPFNTGAGYAMGLRAGAEMTSFEMRFIALRVKDTLSPTGTIAQGVKVEQVNALGENYQKRYRGNTTPLRLYATLQENLAGRGPCYLDTTGLDREAGEKLKEAYLHMSPGILLKWADQGVEPWERPVEICGSEPYLAGGHGLAGYWVDTGRRTTVAGLYAAGDVAGGAPKKYVSGSMAEGEIAAASAVQDMQAVSFEELPAAELARALELEAAMVLAPLTRQEGFAPRELEERLQKVMDEYAGGIGSSYRVSGPSLLVAREELAQLSADLARLKARDLHELLSAQEVIDRVLVARVLVEHLLYRQETRWPCYQERLDYPQRDDTNWLKFVNSRYHWREDRVEMLERPYWRHGEQA
ncbi:MAG: adenylyl-sulfate reductase subunit alpha [Bacillota bacterium]